jgi:hypothetical protein
MWCLVQSARPSLHSNIFCGLLRMHVGLILIPQFEDIKQLLAVCSTTAYFQLEDKFYQQKRARQWEIHCLRWSVLCLWNTLTKQHWLQHTTNPLNGSDTSTTLPLFSNMGQQGYRNFFTISTALSLPSNSQWRVKLLIPFRSWTFYLRSGFQNWPQNCTGSLLILVFICASSSTTHIT